MEDTTHEAAAFQMPNGESWLLFTDQHLCFPMTAYDRQCYFNEMVGLPWYCSAWTGMSKWKLIWRVGWRESSISTGDCGKKIALRSAQYRHLGYSCFSCSWRNPFLVIRHTEKAWSWSMKSNMHAFPGLYFFLSRCQSSRDLDANSSPLFIENTPKCA